MSDDFYCTEVLSGRTPVTKLIETENVLAFYHTRPAYPVHIVVIPKGHIDSLITLQDEDNDLLVEMVSIIKTIATQVVKQHGACRVVTNLGAYQDSKHLHWHIISGDRLP
jgi:histidine triad (HIT) family protein